MGGFDVAATQCRLLNTASADIRPPSRRDQAARIVARNLSTSDLSLFDSPVSRWADDSTWAAAEPVATCAP